jgi:hypothetical protein
MRPGGEAVDDVEFALVEEIGEDEEVMDEAYEEIFRVHVEAGEVFRPFGRVVESHIYLVLRKLCDPGHQVPAVAVHAAVFSDYPADEADARHYITSNG